ncbi:DUF6884 domain-containing protein [Gracilibacillus xinjiangensis]|uniref:DUF6884 domain-containing protein n=1 Tax=Gracilibacillus xinjiangensis TaxID=1193282 RepID=A0ABV8X031_9BACI
MQKLCVIPCGKRKIWDKYPNAGAVKAEKAYTGIFRQLTLAYAEKFFLQNVTISAKHGFLLPDDLIFENYDLTFHKSNPEVITTDRLKGQLKEKQLDHFKHIIVLTGKKYQPIMEEVFDQADLIEYPLLGTRGIGDMQRRLKKSILYGQPIHTEKGGIR